MKGKLGITFVAASILFSVLSCADNSGVKYTETNTDIETGNTLEVSQDSLIRGFNFEIIKLKSKIDSLDKRIEAVGGNVDEPVINSKKKLIAYKDNLEDQTDKIAAATEENWEDVKIEANREWIEFKSNIAETEKVIEDYFNNRTNNNQ